MIVYLFGSSVVSAGPAAPWVISASIPLGAIIFWFKREKFIELAKEANKPIHSTGDAPPDWRVKIPDCLLSGTEILSTAYSRSWHLPGGRSIKSRNIDWTSGPDQQRSLGHSLVLHLGSDLAGILFNLDVIGRCPGYHLEFILIQQLPILTHKRG